MSAHLTYRILGPLAVRVQGTPDGGRWELVTGRLATALSVLLANQSRTVPGEQLQRALWPDPPATVQTQLHRRMADLRRLLARTGRRDRLVNYPGLGYRLVVAHGELDADVFTTRVVQAEQDLAAGRPDTAYPDLRAALAMWQEYQPSDPGDPLAEVIRSLSRRRLRAAERLFALALARHDYDLILDLAPGLAAPDPSWERIWAAWIIALFRTERRSQAVAVGEEFETFNYNGPNPLRDLCYAVTDGKTAQVDAYARRLHATGAPEPMPFPLPADLPELTGRADETDQAGWPLREPGRLAGPVVLTGPPGVGKTVLAIHVAHQLRAQFPDGVWLVELRATHSQSTDVDEMLARLLRALGVPATEIPPDRASRVVRYRQRLADRRLLLILDDAADAAGLAPLLPGPDSVASALVTSQVQLDDVPGFHPIPVEPLDLDAAVELFRTVAVGRGAALAGARPADLRRMAETCGGLPLALQVAGALQAEYRHLTTGELVALVNAGGLDTLVHADRSVPAALATGYDRLDGLARTLLRRLALLDLPELAPWVAAAAFDTTPAVAEPLLARLARRNLLRASAAGADAPPRYRMHDLVRRYARQLAEREEDRADVVGRVYGALLGLAEQAHRQLVGGDFESVHGAAGRWHLPAETTDVLLADPLVWYEQERLNLRTAVIHAAHLGLDELSWDLAISCHEFYDRRGWFDDWAQTHTAALAACRRAGNTRGEASLLVSLGQPTLANSRPAGLPGPVELARAVDLFAAAGDRRGEALARRTLGTAYRRAGALAEARRELVAARAGYQDAGDRFGEWLATRLLGQTCLDLDDPAEAQHHLTDTLALAQGLGYDRAVPQTTYWLGRAHLAQTNLAAARDCFQQTIAYAEPAADVTGVAYGRHGLGDVARADGRWEDAGQLLDEARLAAQLAGDAVLEGRILCSLGLLLRDQADARAADRHFAEAIDRFESCHAGWLRAVAQQLRVPADVGMGRDAMGQPGPSPSGA